MDWTNLALTLAKGWLRLTASVAIGITLGALLEISGWLEKLSRALSPLIKGNRLPPVCASSFLLAFASPRSANSLLASWYNDGRISRRSLILGGIAHTFPASSVHIRSIAFILIPLLGPAGAAYVLFLLMVSALCSISTLILGRLWKEEGGGPGSREEPKISNGRRLPNDFFRLIKKRFFRIYSRVMMLSFPLYALILFFTRLGLFHRLNQLLPAPLTRVLPAESLSIMSSHLSGVLNAAAIARPFLEEGVLSPIQVFTTLIFGYAISLPLRTLRHVLPSALGIYPGRTGLKIAAYTQGFKLVLAVASTVIFLPMGVTR